MSSLTLLLSGQSWHDDAASTLAILALLWVWEGDGARVIQLCLRSWQLLRWILLPTFVLHAAFTPGALLVPEWLPWLTREGIEWGWTLCWHWVAIFMWAMFAGRLLPLSVCLQGLSHTPRLHAKLEPYLRLFPALNIKVRALIRRHYRQWQTSPHKFRTLPQQLATLLHHILHHADRHALYVWQHWHKGSHASPIIQPASTSTRIGFLLCVATSFYVVAFIRLYG